MAEIAGVKDEWLRTFSKRSIEAAEHNAALGITCASAEDMERAVLATRRPKGHQVDAPELRDRGQLDLEQRVLDSAARRRGEGSGVVDEDLVRAAFAAGPLTLGEDQAAAVRSLLRDGDGVALVVAGAGAGETTALSLSLIHI